MVDINKFIEISEFPAIGRENGATAQLTFPTTSLSAYASDTHSTTVSVGSGDITTATITMDGVAYPVEFLQMKVGDFMRQVNVQRISPTAVEIVYYVSNETSSTKTFSSNTITVDITAFRVP